MLYLVEAFRPRAGIDVPRGPVIALPIGQEAVRLIARLRVPADEVVFWLFDAPSRDDLDTVLADSGIGSNRISEVADLVLAGAEGEAARPERRRHR